MQCGHWTHRVFVNMCEELLARLSCPGRLFICPTWALSAVGTVDCDLRRYSTTVTRTALRSTQTVTLITGFVAVLTLAVFTYRHFDTAFCCRFGVAVSTCRRFDHERRAAAHRHRFFGSDPVSYFSSHYVCLALDLLKQPSSIFYWERVSLNTTSAPSATCLCRLPQPPARNQPSMYSFFAQKWYGLLSFWALSWLWARML